MTELDVPVIGNVPEKWVYAGGAVVAGVVGYAYLTRNKRGTLDADEQLIGEAGEVYDAYGNLIGQPGSTPGYVPPTVVDSNVDVDDREGVTTNDEWGRLARDELVAYGANAGAVTAALGKFLTRQPLTAVDAALVRQAIVVAGYPPQGGPWNVVEPTTTPPDSIELPAPVVTAGNITAQSVTFNWTRVPGAKSYIVGVEKAGAIIDERNVGDTTIHTVNVAGWGHVGLNVWAVNDQGQRGAKGRKVVTVPGAPTAAKGSLRIKAAPSRNAIGWMWDPYPGAVAYSVAPEIAGKTLGHVRVGGPGWSWSGLQPDANYAVNVVAVGPGNVEISKWTRHVSKTTK